MAQWALNVGLAGVDLTQPRIAPAGSGVFFMVRRSTANVAAFLAKLDSSGAASWRRLITQGSTIARHHLCGLGSDSVVATEASDGVNLARINGSDGTISWQVKLTDVAGGWVPTLPTVGSPLATDPSGNIYLAVRNSGDSVRYVVKFDGSDGSVLWASQVGSASFACEVRAIACMSDDRPVLAWTNSSDSGVVVLNASTGDLSWARKLAISSAATTYWRIAVDPSNNVYHLASQDSGGNYYKLCISKFDSSGATTWDATLTEGGSHYNRAASLVADASYVYAGAWAQENSNAYKQHSIARLNAAGSTVSSVTYSHPRSPLFTNDGLESQALVSGGHYGAGFDENTVAPNRDEAVIFRNEAFDAVTLGDDDYVRSALAYTAGAGSATITTITPTITTSISTTTGSGDLSSAADSTYTLTLFEEVVGDGPLRSGTGSASGSSTAQAYSPAVAVSAAGTSTAEAFSNQGVGTAAGTSTAQAVNGSTTAATGTAAGSSTAQARYGYTYPVGYGIAPTIGFGIHALLQHRTASSIVPTTRFGTPSLLLTPAEDQPYLATQLEATARFGTPTLLLALTAQATGEAPTTAFGSATLRRRMPVTSSAPATAFGTPVLRRGHVAAGFSGTLFGLPALVMPFTASGLAPGVRFGTPRLVGSTAHIATGFQASVQFGTAALGGQRSRARAAGPSTRFGTATLSQSLPP